MGKRATMFRCRNDDCGTDFWEWFEWLTAAELVDFAHDTTCPECGSDDWEMTDTSEFAGGRLEGEAGYPHWMQYATTTPEARETLGITDLADRVAALAVRLDALEDHRDAEGDE